MMSSIEVESPPGVSMVIKTRLAWIRAASVDSAIHVIGHHRLNLVADADFNDLRRTFGRRGIGRDALPFQARCGGDQD